MARLFVTDLDGTLLDSRGRLTAPVHAAMARLGEAGVLRAVATGRSLYSVRRVLPPGAPIDYLIYSSGAGLMRYPDGRSLCTWNMSEAAVREASGLFEREQVDFMVHAPAPESHRFAFRAHRRHPDLLARVTRYVGHCWALEADGWRGPACQLLAIPFDCEDPAAFCESVRRALPGHAVVRTTSPLDHRSLWVEIFPPHVSKAHASEHLAQVLAIPAGERFAVGNDYNDESLLSWASHACVMGNGPEPLRRRHGSVATNDQDGVVAALARFGLPFA